MKRLLAFTAAIAALSVAACAPSETKPEAKPEAAAAEKPAVTIAPVSLVGQWTGTIKCYSIESPLTVNIDGGNPEKPEIAKGEGGALKWTAALSIDAATHTVTMKSDTPTDGSDMLVGVLNDDLTAMSGKMDKQLCTEFALKRTA